MKLTVGADPELFLIDPISKQYVPAIGLIGGTKHHPKKTENGAVQEDNVMAEFCIPPATTPNELITNIQAVLKDLAQIVPQYGFSTSPSAFFDPNQLRHRQAREAGCEPDYNAWEEFSSPKFKNPKPPVVNGNLRTAGGHVHVGFALPEKFEEAVQERINLTRCLDVSLGIPSILMDRDEHRRKLYGKAGAHRPKDYGLEYRVLSNFWIWDNKYIKWIWNGVEKALELKKHWMERVNLWEDKITNTINESDTTWARRVSKYFGVEVL